MFRFSIITDLYPFRLFFILEFDEINHVPIGHSTAFVGAFNNHPIFQDAMFVSLASFPGYLKETLFPMQDRILCSSSVIGFVMLNLP
jgi:hypothetical protein